MFYKRCFSNSSPRLATVGNPFRGTIAIARFWCAKWEGFWRTVLRRVLRSGLSMVFTVEKGSEKGFSEGVLRRGFPEAASERATP